MEKHQSMRNPAKAIVGALLIAIPSPFILGFLLVALTPEAIQNLSMSEAAKLATNTPFILGSAQGISAYLITVLLFGIAAYLGVALYVREGKRKPARKPVSQGQQAPRSHTEAEEDQDDSEGPEGSEEGTVKWFNVKKGFGFIVRDQGDEIFVHFRAIRGRGRRVLRQGQLVRFDVVEAEKGLQADNVSTLSD
jgi:CspA family cold shock protein